MRDELADLPKQVGESLPLSSRPWRDSVDVFYKLFLLPPAGYHGGNTRQDIF